MHFDEASPAQPATSLARQVQAIFAEASLSFLGAGVPPPTPTWGGVLHDGYPYLEKNAWQTFVPGVCIFLAVLSCNFVGDGLRDLLDPKERTRRS